MGTKEMKYFKSFKDMSTIINSSLNLKEVLDLITKNITRVLNVKACTLFLLDKERKRLKVSATFGLSEAYLKKGTLDADKSITDSLEGNAVLIYDVQEDSRIQYPEEAMREGISSILSVPIPVKGTVIGVLRIYAAQPYRFSDNEIEFVSGLAEMGGIAIVNARMYEHLKEDSQNLIEDAWEWYETLLPSPS